MATLSPYLGNSILVTFSVAYIKDLFIHSFYIKKKKWK